MYIDRLILLFVVGAYLLSPVIIDGWRSSGAAWYHPYTVWALLIALGFWIARNRDLNDL